MTNKLTRLCLMPLLALILSTSLAKALTYGDFEYTLFDSNSQVQIDAYTGSGVVVVIPSAIDERPVTRIGASAFRDNGSITQVFIPDTVINIETSAFQNCAGLNSVVIGAGIADIDSNAFKDASKLHSIHFLGDAPASVAGSAFDGTAAELTVFHSTSASGFTAPTWKGRPTFSFDLNLNGHRHRRFRWGPIRPRRTQRHLACGPRR